MSAQLEAPSVQMPALPDDVLSLGLEYVESRDSVQRWIKRGRPMEDIDMEVVNILRHDMRHVGLVRFLNAANEQCGTSHAETLRATLMHLATASSIPKESG